jgi:phosphoenolpyruvate carboxykinase (ATP)
MATTDVLSSQEAEINDLLSGKSVHRNLYPGPLVEHAIRRGEARLANHGQLAAETGKRSGRSPKDKFTVKDEVTEKTVKWGPVNQPIDAEQFDRMYRRVLHYLKGRELFVQDLYCGADPEYRLPVRVINELAWQNLFVRQLFIRPVQHELRYHRPEFTVICAPNFFAEPERDGTNSETFIYVSFSRRIVLVGGSGYAGEMKKSIFGVMNFILPPRNVFPMHCSANLGADGVSALFFGLSGTGKTTLSADPERRLIGDDEHGWSERGVFNFEGGCYAKCIRLSREKEPQIWNALRFGSVLENVVIDPETHIPNYDDDSLTENTRAAYPVDFIDNAVIPGIGGHPKHVVFLTADAFGVLPPISRLNNDQAMYHFLSGYTAKVAGTEAGMGSEPEATFSTCFGAPFLPLPPKVYAEMLGRRLKEHNAQCWLVNTGWQGGRFGVGKRMSLPYTRAMVRAAVAGSLDHVHFHMEPTFGLSIPNSCPDVPSELLDPRNSWADKADYDRTAAVLTKRFAENFEKFEIADHLRHAAPAPIKK